MVELIISVAIVLILAVLIVLNYLPVFKQKRILEDIDAVFAEELVRLKKLYSCFLVVETRKLGLGSSQNSDVKFEKAHQNQAVALSCVLKAADVFFED